MDDAFLYNFGSMQANKKYTYITVSVIVVLATIAVLLLGKGKEEKTVEPPSPSDIAVLVQQESKLYSAEQTAHKTISFSTKEAVSVFGHDITVPWSGTTARIPITVTYKACIDLSRIKADDISVAADSTITVTLPEPEIEMTSCEIEHGKEVYYKQLFSRTKSQEFINGKVEQAERSVWSDISMTSKNQLLDEARQSANKTIAAVLLQAGYKKVNVTYSPSMDINKLRTNIIEFGKEQ